MKRLLPAMLIYLTGLTISLYAELPSTGLEVLPEALNRALPEAQPRGVMTAANGAPGSGGKVKSLPSRVDLSPFLPPVGHQGSIGSCSAWSTVYYAKTLQENQEREWGADKKDHQYSPLFTYNQITGGVNRGTAITQHMTILEEKGATPFPLFPHTDNIKVLPGERAYREAENYRSASHKRLDRYDENRGQWVVELHTVKAMLAEGLPVIGGFEVYENFYNYKGGIYKSVSGRPTGGHAMCIVGYDDDIGALRIVNSWGEAWGDGGFLWLDYDLFETLCIYNCAVMYDIIDSPAKETAPPAPAGLSASMGGFTDRIVLDWMDVEGADFYIVYRVDNKEGVLNELGRSATSAYADEKLLPGVNYIYAVQSIRRGRSGLMGSGYSEIIEGWTAEEKNPPGIPSRVTYSFREGCPVLSWDAVAEAEGYSVFRWDPPREAFMKIGTSRDTAFRDAGFTELKQGGIIYYSVQAYNRYGEGASSDGVGILRELREEKEEIKPEPEPVIPDEPEEKDDIILDEEEQEEFDGDYHRSDYFDYEYSMQRFREYYRREMEAFRKYREDEMRAFEAWKMRNGYGN
jgi:hypothetical protein